VCDTKPWLEFALKTVSPNAVQIDNAFGELHSPPPGPCPTPFSTWRFVIKGSLQLLLIFKNFNADKYVVEEVMLRGRD